MYYRTIPGSLALSDIERQVQDEESGASKLVECKIAQVRTGDAVDMVNMVKFLELPAGTRLPSVRLTHANDAGPSDGAQPELSCVMLVEGTATLVHVHRVAESDL